MPGPGDKKEDVKKEELRENLTNIFDDTEEFENDPTINIFDKNFKAPTFKPKTSSKVEKKEEVKVEVKKEEKKEEKTFENTLGFTNAYEQYDDEEDDEDYDDEELEEMRKEEEKPIIDFSMPNRQPKAPAPEKKEPKKEDVKVSAGSINDYDFAEDEEFDIEKGFDKEHDIFNKDFKPPVYDIEQIKKDQKEKEQLEQQYLNGNETDINSLEDNFNDGNISSLEDKNEIKKDNLKKAEEKFMASIDGVDDIVAEQDQIEANKNQDVVQETQKVTEMLDNMLKNDEEPKQEEVKAGELSQEEAKEIFDHKLDVFNSSTMQNLDANSFTKVIDTFDSEKFRSIPEELKSTEFERIFKENYKKGLENTIKANEQLKADGKFAPSLVEITKQYDEMQKATWQLMQTKGVVDKTYEYPMFGGMGATDIRDMQMNSFLSAPAQYQKNAEKKEITQQFTENKDAQTKDAFGRFDKFIDQINATQNLKFSAQGIQTYLQSRWKEATGRDLDSQKENFQKELKNFIKESYKNMQKKSQSGADKAIENKNFDLYTRHVEQMCKNAGWLDQNARHEFCGGLNPKEMRDMQLDALNAKPKNLSEWAMQQAKNMSLEKKDVETSLKNFQKQLPKADANNIDNKDIRCALAFRKALEQVHNSRNGAYKAAHPRKFALENQAINALTKIIEDKGYKQVIDYINKNPLKGDNDFITQQYNKDKSSIDENLRYNEKIAMEANKLKETVNENHLGKRIYVPEADDRQEIVNPQVKSPAVTLNKVKSLEVVVPQNSGK